MWNKRLKFNNNNNKTQVFEIDLFWEPAAAAKSLQSCPTLCDPRDGSPSGSPIPGILQARTLEWVAISFSNAWKWKVKVKSLSHVRLLATPWTAAYQAPLSLGFSRQEYWSGVPLPSPFESLVDRKMEKKKKKGLQKINIFWAFIHQGFCRVISLFGQLNLLMVPWLRSEKSYEEKSYLR